MQCIITLAIITYYCKFIIRYYYIILSFLLHYYDILIPFTIITLLLHHYCTKYYYKFIITHFHIIVTSLLRHYYKWEII